METLTSNNNKTAINNSEMTNEEKAVYSKKLKEAENFDALHKETYSLNDIISQHRERYGI